MKPEQLSITQLIRIGFFVGIGFSVPLTICTYFPFFFLEDFVAFYLGEDFEDYAEFSSESGLEARIEKMNKEDDGWVFLGILENNGSDEWESVTIQVEVFDEKGDFVDEVDAYVEGAITPGSVHNFKVAMYSCGGDAQINFADFTVAVTSAY